MLSDCLVMKKRINAQIDEPDLSCLLYEKSVFPWAVPCSHQKQLVVHVSILRLSSSVSQNLLPDLPESPFPDSEAGAIIGLLRKLNGMRSIVSSPGPATQFVLHIGKCWYYSYYFAFAFYLV